LCIPPSIAGARNCSKNIARNWAWICPPIPIGWPTEGQTNPYYCAMVEMLDHYIGMLVKYLEKTEDHATPGKN
jgi:hypothetical protein